MPPGTGGASIGEKDSVAPSSISFVGPEDFTDMCSVPLPHVILVLLIHLSLGVDLGSFDSNVDSKSVAAANPTTTQNPAAVAETFPFVPRVRIKP